MFNPHPIMNVILKEHPVLMPFFVVEVRMSCGNTKKVPTNYCYCTELPNGQAKLSDLGELKSMQLQSLVTNGKKLTVVYLKQAQNAEANVIHSIQNILFHGEPDSPYLFCWKEEKCESSAFFKAIGAADESGKPITPNGSKEDAKLGSHGYDLKPNSPFEINNEIFQ